MKLILKIAAGVFLGAALLVVAIVWIVRVRENAALTQAKAAEKAEWDKLEKLTEPMRPHLLAGMTPELLMTRCGKPLKDETAANIVIDHKVVHGRNLTYRVSAHERIQLLFSDDENWALTGWLGFRDRPPYVEDPLMGFDEKTAIRRLPCLAPK